MPQKLILIRHGETNHNKKKICQGCLDIPLNSFGKSQAKRLANTLKPEQIDLIYSSDLSRTVQTAQPLAQQKNIPLIKTTLLRERNMGVLQGLSWSQIKKTHKKTLKKLDDKSDVSWKMKNGESWNNVVTRIKEFLQLLSNKHPNKSIAVVTHGGSKRAILQTLGFKDLSTNTYIANTDLTIIEKTANNEYSIRTTTITPRNLSLSLSKMLQINKEQ